MGTKFNLNSTGVSHHNQTLVSYDYELNCGANNCPQTPLNVLLSKPTESSVFILYISLCSLVVLAMAITFMFTDNLSYRDMQADKNEKLTLKVIGK